MSNERTQVKAPATPNERPETARSTFDLTTKPDAFLGSDFVFGAYAEAASVVLTSYHELSTRAASHWYHNDKVQDARDIIWTEPTAVQKTTHGNAKDATEYGAYAIAFLIAAALDFVVVGRSEQGSGCDWIMRRASGGTETFKLEVSGIAQGGSPGSRLATKVKQGQTGTLKAPGLAVIVRFSEVSLHSEDWT
jgi:hypothetical protein